MMEGLSRWSGLLWELQGIGSIISENFQKCKHERIDLIDIYWTSLQIRS